MFIARALSPAIITSVKIDKVGEEGERSKATVTIPSDQKSKAIGKAGLNIRLASMLTKTDIELIEIESKAPSISVKDNTETPQEKTADTASLEALFK